LKEAAQREGRVVVAGPGFPGLRQGLVEGFQQAHGITVEYLGLPSGEAITRVDREAKAGTVTIDVNLGGASPCWTMAERGQIDDVAGSLVDPQSIDPSGWRGGALRFTKPTTALPGDFRCALQTAEWVMTDLFVNRDIIQPDSIRSWKDLLRPEYKGRIAAYDPRRSGPGGGTLGHLAASFGPDYVRDLYVGQEVMLTQDNRQLAEWVARGSYPVGLSLVQAAVEPLRAEGLPLERVFPMDDQGSVTAGFGVIMKIKGAPHPNAAAVFINWFASREAQEMYEREMMETSLRTDVSHQVPAYVIPKPGVEYKYDNYDPAQHFGYLVPAQELLERLLGR
jgi:ABC-type Fe3+ transport system substrate-binding protein